MRALWRQMSGVRCQPRAATPSLLGFTVTLVRWGCRLAERSSPPHRRPTIPRPQEGARSILPASTPGEASTLT